MFILIPFIRKFFFLYCFSVLSFHQAQAFVLEDYFPLDFDSSYTYQIDGDPSVTETAIISPGTVLVGSEQTRQINLSASGIEFYTNDENGLRFHRFLDNGIDDFVLTPPLLIANANVETGDVITSNSSTSFNLDGFGMISFTASNTTVINGLEEVTVPVGTFTALKVTQQRTSLTRDVLGQAITSFETRVLWLVEHLGAVRTENFDEDNLEPILSELIAVDLDGDGLDNSVDPDDDNDGVNDDEDIEPFDPEQSQSVAPVNVPTMPWGMMLFLAFVFFTTQKYFLLKKY